MNQPVSSHILLDSFLNFQQSFSRRKSVKPSNQNKINAPIFVKGLPIISSNHQAQWSSIRNEHYLNVENFLATQRRF